MQIFPLVMLLVPVSTILKYFCSPYLIPARYFIQDIVLPY